MYEPLTATREVVTLDMVTQGVSGRFPSKREFLRVSPILHNGFPVRARFPSRHAVEGHADTHSNLLIAGKLTGGLANVANFGDAVKRTGKRSKSAIGSVSAQCTYPLPSYDLSCAFQWSTRRSRTVYTHPFLSNTPPVAQLNIFTNTKRNPRETNRIEMVRQRERCE